MVSPGLQRAIRKMQLTDELGTEEAAEHLLAAEARIEAARRIESLNAAAGTAVTLAAPTDSLLEAVERLERVEAAKSAKETFKSIAEKTTRDKVAAPAAPAAAQVAPIARAQAQDECVLAALVASGYDPQALPPWRLTQGKPYAPKEAVRQALDGKPGYTHDVIDHAWKRLRKEGRIQDAALGKSCPMPKVALPKPSV